MFPQLLTSFYLFYSNFGAVEDVRIPCNNKRMFGFVTFRDWNTVQMILSKGNPHYICGARILVKPYKEKSKLNDRYHYYVLFLKHESWENDDTFPVKCSEYFLNMGDRKYHDILETQFHHLQLDDAESDFHSSKYSRQQNCEN